MTAPVPGGGRLARIPAGRHAIAWLVLFVAAAAAHLGRETLPAAAVYPESWIVPLRFWISDLMKWLVNDFDLGLFTFKEMTRSIAWLLEWPLRAAQSLFAEGFSRGIGRDAVEIVPRIPWIALIVVCALMGLSARGFGLAALVAGAFLYLAVFGQWDSAMVTLASIVIAVPLGAGAGLLLGIAGFRSVRIERALVPLLDLMQTVPIFAYLVPVLFLFGFGPVAAMVATVIYATPPMVRVTMLALRQVPAEVVEFGRMAGCSRRQLLWKVLVPSARPSLMVGINQVIMLSLNMVIIASMIGAGGLGYDVLTSLKRLRIGDGVEAGLAITLLAIALDRLSQAIRQPPAPGARRHRRVVRPSPPLPDRGGRGARRVLARRRRRPRPAELSGGSGGQHRAHVVRAHQVDQRQLLRPPGGGQDLAALQPADSGQALSHHRTVAGGGRRGRHRRAPARRLAARGCSPPPSRCSWRSRETGRSR